MNPPSVQTTLVSPPLSAWIFFLQRGDKTLGHRRQCRNTQEYGEYLVDTFPTSYLERRRGVKRTRPPPLLRAKGPMPKKPRPVPPCNHYAGRQFKRAPSTVSARWPMGGQSAKGDVGLSQAHSRSAKRSCNPYQVASCTNSCHTGHYWFKARRLARAQSQTDMQLQRPRSGWRLLGPAGGVRPCANVCEWI